jgi:tetratricopeptide (TPR) repeat protein
MLLRLLSCVLLVIYGSALARAEIPINPAGRSLVEAATQLHAEGKSKAAIEMLVKASVADPASSLPLSTIASIFADAAAGATGEAKTRLGGQASAAARAALSRNPIDPVAQEVLRRLLDEQAPDPLHLPTPAARALVAEGEALFQQKRYNEALSKYEAAASQDPMYSVAWVYAGDCFYAQSQWPQAEQRFRKAVQTEPLNAQAWRYLSDALYRQGKDREGERALFGAIAAHPSQLPNWEKLAVRMRASGLVLKRFVLVRKAGVSMDKSGGKPTVSLQSDFGGDSADGTFWTSYGMGLAQAKLADPKISAYALELAGLRTALQVDRELAEKGQRKFTDPSLASLRKLGAEGQLETASCC